VSGDSAKGGKKKQGVARETADCVGAGGDVRATTAIVEPVAYSLREDATANNFSATEIETARALQALQPSVQSHHAQTFITQPILLDGRRVDDVPVYSEPVQTLQERMGTGGNNVPVVAQDTTVFTPSAARKGGQVWEGVVPTLRAEAKQGDNTPHVIQETILSFDTQFGSNANVFEDQEPTLKASQQPPSVTQQEVGYTATSFAKYVEGVGTLKAHGGDLGGGSETIIISEQTQAISYDGYNQTIEEEIHRSWRIGRDSSDFIADLREPTLIVRRLTPLECERLMGWPDNHTAQGINGAVSDTNRYKMCGNGIASPVAQWLAKHILATHPDAN
jgi:site-specific DNA-cytosine methylase